MSKVIRTGEDLRLAIAKMVRDLDETTTMNVYEEIFFTEVKNIGNNLFEVEWDEEDDEEEEPDIPQD
jgi:hypothetical protein